MKITAQQLHCRHAKTAQQKFSEFHRGRNFNQKIMVEEVQRFACLLQYSILDKISTTISVFKQHFSKIKELEKGQN